MKRKNRNRHRHRKPPREGYLSVKEVSAEVLPSAEFDEPDWTDDEDGDDDEPEFDLPIHQFASERVNRVIRRLMEGKDFKTIDEMNEFLDQHVNGRSGEKIGAGLESDPIEQAQNLAFDAWECDSQKKALKLARQALELDPECTDALRLQAYETADSPEDALARFQDIAERAAQRLGSDYFGEKLAPFWGAIETRPYMRARVDVLTYLRLLARNEEAIRECEDLIRLNPNDNQGNRYILLGLYLGTNNLRGARRLFKRLYPDEYSSVFAWGKVFERILSADETGAQKALEEAYEVNPHVFDYLAGRKTPPRHYPQCFKLGGSNEAVDCLTQLAPALLAHRHILEWFSDHIPSRLAWDIIDRMDRWK